MLSANTSHDAALRERFRALRAAEFSRLDAVGEVYLDYTGAGLYPESLVDAHAGTLRRGLLGNPHSAHAPSERATAEIADARLAVLRFFGADPGTYDVVFTANATGALRLVGEGFRFGPRSRLVLTADNHNSVNGIREFALRRGAAVQYLALDRELRVAPGGLDIPPATPGAPSLFAFPAQSNFSGVRHSLELVHRARDAGYTVVLDAAAFAPTSPLDLTAVQPDFVAVAFYKMFGYPTGVGALIARREALDALERPWFAGGTVEFASVEHPRHQLLVGAEAFEDGTPNFLAIGVVPAGLAFLASVGMTQLHERIGVLTADLLERLSRARQANGAARVRVYGPTQPAGRGGTVAFNLLDATGSVIPYDAVERGAARCGIAVRGGCFCNPGAAEAAFELDSDRWASCLDRFPRGTFTPQRFSACLGGQPVGAVRASLGVATTEDDLDRLERFVCTFPSPLRD